MQDCKNYSSINNCDSDTKKYICVCVLYRKIVILNI